MDGFKSFFTDAEKNYKNSKVDLENFRSNRSCYGFCMNEGGFDGQAINYAMNINKDLCAKFMNQPKSKIGYEDKDKYVKIDDSDSKHILILTFLFNDATDKYKKIVEIGGGFGNMCRLCNNIITFTQWDIIDIPHMLELQKFYLENEIAPSEVSQINFIDAYSNKKYENLDLVIGTHSVSEFSWEDFVNYFNNVIANSKYFYMGYNKMCPSPFLINKKLEFIYSNNFILEKNFDYTEIPHGAHVSYTLFKNKKYNI